jgi:S-formylglutathione hydrolase FrmB
MRYWGWLGMVLLLAVSIDSASARGLVRKSKLDALNARLWGQILDFTNNHGRDNRIWFPALQQKRDLYVYLPPGYRPEERYPAIILLHGFTMDEHMFLRFAPFLDDAMASGRLPPAIVACPDGSLTGRASILSPGSFFINSEAGAFEDFILRDLWQFMLANFPIRPEREAHVLAGVSMGGFAAYSLGIRHRQDFGVLVGLFPPVNLRWLDCCCNYFGNFDPQCWGWRTEIHRYDVVGKFAGGLVKLRAKHFLDPLFSSMDEALAEISRLNPIELIDRTDLREGELALYIGYGDKDQFNIDAQVESFLYLAKCRGITVEVGFVPRGKHNVATAIQLWPGLVSWLAARLEPYRPGITVGEAATVLFPVTQK